MANWRTLDNEPIESIYDEMDKEFKIAYDKNYDCKVFVGVDSQNVARGTSFVQVVAIHVIRDTGQGDGGRVFYVKHLERRYKSRRERLLREAELSIALAQKINPVCDEYGIDFEVHLDVNSEPGLNNENKSHEVHDMAKGWVQGMGFNVKTKPDAIAASFAADRHVRGVKHRKKINELA